MSDLRKPMQAFELTSGERHSPLWARLKEHLEARLHQARSKNDGIQSEQSTADLRGEIRTLKGLIALGTEPPIDG